MNHKEKPPRKPSHGNFILKFTQLSALIACFLTCGEVAAADETLQLPLRCQKVERAQKLNSSSYLLAAYPEQIRRRLRNCRTYARKNLILSAHHKIDEYRDSNANLLPATINLVENTPLELSAISENSSNESKLYLWTIRYNGTVHFSTDATLKVRFPDDANVLLRLWIHDRSSGVVQKHLTTITVVNAAPESEIVLPAKIRAGKRVTLRARVNDPGTADTRSGFHYLWNVGIRTFSVREGISNVIEHRFKKVGTYPVSLLVTDKDGASTFVQQTVTVESAGTSLPDSPSGSAVVKLPLPSRLPGRNVISNDAAASPHGLAEWEAQMLKYGKKHCSILNDKNVSADHRLGTTYYDAEWVYYQIAQYTGDPFWQSCARSAERAYRDGYVQEWEGRVPGYWNFTHGLLEDFLQSGDSRSRDAVIQISHSAAYAADSTPLEWTSSADLSREVAYAIMSYVNAEKAGAPRRARLGQLYKQAHGHLRQWFIDRSAPYVRPFMVALTAQALIEYDEWIGDPAIVPALKQALDALWETTWIPTEQTFQYTDRNHETGGTEPAYDLNLLIAPAYAWIYKETRDVSYREKADLIFAGGVKNAWLENGKQFNQNYRWAFRYLEWRK